MATTKSSNPANNSPTIFGQHRPEVGQRLTPAESKARLLARLAAAADTLKAPAPTKARREPGKGRGRAAAVALTGDLATAMADLGWFATTYTLEVIPRRCSPEAFAAPVPTQPDRYSPNAATMLAIAHGANGLLPSLASGEPVTLSDLLTVVSAYRKNQAFHVTLTRKGEVRTEEAQSMASFGCFVRTLAATMNRQLSIDLNGDTIAVLSA